jgi:hypothetical protein
MAVLDPMTLAFFKINADNVSSRALGLLLSNNIPPPEPLMCSFTYTITLLQITPKHKGHVCGFPQASKTLDVFIYI